MDGSSSSSQSAAAITPASIWRSRSRRARHVRRRGNKLSGRSGRATLSGSPGGGMKRNVWIGTAFLAVLGALLVAQGFLGRAAMAQAQGKTQAPRFEVDPFWPKPMPNHWLLGNTIGVTVDSQDNVWLVHRGAANLNNNGPGDSHIVKFTREGKFVAQYGKAKARSTGKPNAQGVPGDVANSNDQESF